MTTTEEARKEVIRVLTGLQVSNMATMERREFRSNCREFLTGLARTLQAAKHRQNLESMAATLRSLTDSGPGE